MSHFVRVLTLAVTLTVAAAAQTGADANWSDRFHVPGLLTRVFAVGTWNGDLIAGGQTFESRGHTLQHVARYDGRMWQPIGAGVGGLVRAICEFRGDLIVAGQFSLPAGSIARWDGTQWHPLGSGFTNSQRVIDGAEVFDLAVFRDQLYAAGFFDSAGGRTAVGIARWDGTQWHPVGGTGVTGSWEPKGLSLAVYQDRLYLGGEFDAVGGVAARNVAVYDGARFQALGSGLGAATGDGVHALEAFGGEIYAGGVFRNAGSTTTLKIARWNGTAWRPVGLGIPDWAISARVASLQVFGGSLYVGGNFIRVDGQTTGVGVLARAVARWDGTQWHGFGGIEGSDLATTAIAMTEWNGKLVIGGEFDYGGTPLQVGDAVVSTGVIAFDGSSTWTPLGVGLGGAGAVKLVAWNGGIVAVGGFLEAGTALSPRVAFFDGHEWSYLGAYLTDGNVKDAIVFQGDLIVAGEFRRLNGTQVGSVVRYDGNQWTDMGYGGTSLAIYNGELYAGGLGGANRWTGSSWVRLPQFFGQVMAMQEYAGRLYIGGLLGTGSGARPNLFAWDGSQLTPVGTGTSDAVETMCVYQGELIVGGRFTSAGGVAARHVAAWNGSSFRQLGPGTGGTYVGALGVHDGELYLGGDLGNFWNSNPKFVGKFDGTAFQPLGSDLDGPAKSFLSDPDTGELWMGGGFTEAGVVPAQGLTIWHTRPRFQNLGGALAGPRGFPVLDGFGALQAGETVRLRATGFTPASGGLFAFGFAPAFQPLFGGTLVPRLDVTVTFAADGFGNARLALPIGAAVPPGVSLYVQAWAFDPGTQAFAATDGVRVRS